MLAVHTPHCVPRFQIFENLKFVDWFIKRGNVIIIGMAYFCSFHMAIFTWQLCFVVYMVNHIFCTRKQNICFIIDWFLLLNTDWCSPMSLFSFVDLPNLSSSIYSTGLCNRLRAFFEGSPPSGLSPPVTELVIATADFQRDLSEWNIR